MPLGFNLLASAQDGQGAPAPLLRQARARHREADHHIQFEHSPGRGDNTFTADGTAFGAIAAAQAPDGAKTFIAAEVKHSES
jgi:hypothetical protein